MKSLIPYPINEHPTMMVVLYLNVSALERGKMKRRKLYFITKNC